MSLLYWIVFGLITGSVADFISPSVTGGILGSILLGILGAVVGGYIGERFFGVEGANRFQPTLIYCRQYLVPYSFSLSEECL